MRVVHVTLSFEPGGRREAIRALARRHRELGVVSDLCCLDHLGCDEGDLGATFARSVVLARRGLFDRRAVGILTKFCDDAGADLLHTHDAASQAIAALVRLGRPKLRLLMTFHRSLGIESASRLARVRNAIAGGLSQAVVVGSRERMAHFLQENWIRSQKVVRIPFGIDLSKFRPDRHARAEVRREIGADDRTIVFGAVGHFGPEKGIDVVLTSFREFSTKLSDDAPVKLLVLGNGNDQQREAMQQLSQGSSPGRVLLAGFRKDAPRWFNAMDVFVHAPRLEAFGLVLAEAMATSLPIIATSVGGVPDLVRHETNGLLAASEDSGALAEAMHRLWRDPEMRQRLANAAGEIARNEYSCERYAGDYLDLYHDLMAGRAPRGAAAAKPSLAGSLKPAGGSC